MIRIALPVLLAVLFVAAGCGGGANRKEGSEAAQALDFSKLWPKEEVAKLSPEQRQRLLEQALAGLKGTNWQHSQEVLVALGRDSGPGLINLIGSKEPSAASEGPIPSAKVKSVGNLAIDTLMLLVQTRSSYKGEMPARNQDAWKRWWAANSAAVAVKE
jgi:hypothetical protein